MFNNEAILIIGAGSIGQRHLKNLKTLGIKDIGVLDLREEKLKIIKEKYDGGGVRTYKDLNQSLKENWGAIFICTPPSTHINIASRVIEKKSPIFIEKPLSDNLKNTGALIKKIKKYKIPVMVGYVLNFHPQFVEIKNILNRKILGKIWGIRAEFGQYLPDWHPQENYRFGYSAQKRLGGGIILDDIHEIDYLYHLFGKIEKVFAFAKKISDLKINVEDYAELILWFKKRIIAQIHMDYLQRDPSRSLKIIGEKGTLIWDLKKNTLEYFLAKDKKWHKNLLKNFDFNQVYLKEVKYFLDCIKNNKNPQPDMGRGLETLKIAISARKSAKEDKVILI